MWLRLIGALVEAAAGFFRLLGRAARQLFHETTGALFALFAMLGALSAWREWQRGAAEWLVCLVAGFTLMMGAFAVAAFRSARRVR